MKNILLFVLLSSCFSLWSQEDFFLRIGLPTQYFRAADLAPNDATSYWAIATVSEVNGYDTDIILYKMSIDGITLDSTRFNAPNRQFAQCLSRSDDGHLLIAGTSNPPNQAGADDIHLKYFASSGEQIWSVTFGSEVDDRVVSTTISQLGNIYVAHEALPPDYPQEEKITKLNESGTELWRVDFDNEDQPINAINRLVPLIDDDILVMGVKHMGLNNNHGLLLRMDSEGEILWSATPLFAQASTPISKITDSWVDHFHQKIIVKGHSNTLGSQQIFLFDFAGNQLANFYLPSTVSTEHDRIFYENGILLSVNHRSTTRFGVSLDDHTIEYLNVTSFSNTGTLFAGATMIGNEKVNVTSNTGNMRQLSFAGLLTTTQQFGSSTITNSEWVNGVSIGPDGSTWAVGENSREQQVLSKISVDANLTTDIAPDNASLNNDILVLSNGKIVKSFLAIGTSGTPDTVGYRIYDAVGNLEEEYVDIGNIDVDETWVNAYLEEITDNGFILIISNGLIVDNHLIVKYGTDSQPTAYYNIWPDILYIRAVEVSSDDKIALLGKAQQNTAVLQLLTTNLEGIVDISRTVAPNQNLNTYNWDFVASNDFNKFGLVVSHSQQLVNGLLIKYLSLDAEGMIITETAIPINENSRVRGLTIEEFNDGTYGIVTALDNPSPVLDEEKYSLFYCQIDDDGGVVFAEKNFTKGNPYIRDSDVTINNTIIIGGYYLTVTDRDGLVATFNSNGTISTSSTPFLKTSDTKLWPVPTSEYVNLAVNNDYQGKLTIRIWDVTGRLWNTSMIDKPAKQIITQLQISDLAAGTYLLEIIGDDYHEIQQFSKL